MTTAPTPQTTPEALRLAPWLNEDAWRQMRLGDVEAAGRELKRLHAENLRLRAERDEADRRAGAAERSAAAFHEDNQRFEQVRRRMKEQWGVHDNVSFDVVWQQALDTKQTLAELEARKPLPLSIERLEQIWESLRCFHGGEPLKCGHVEFARLVEVEYGVLGRIPIREENGGQIDHSLITGGSS